MQKIRDWLYIGGIRDTSEPAILREYGVGAVLLLAEDTPLPEDIASLYLPTFDGELLSGEKIRQGVAFLLDARAGRKTALSACGLGISRSTTFAIAALKEAEGLTLADALRDVRQVHPDARPHPILWRSLCAHYGEEVWYREVIAALPEPALVSCGD